MANFDSSHLFIACCRSTRGQYLSPVLVCDWHHGGAGAGQIWNSELADPPSAVCSRNYCRALTFSSKHSQWSHDSWLMTKQNCDAVKHWEPLVIFQRRTIYPICKLSNRILAFLSLFKSDLPGEFIHLPFIAVLELPFTLQYPAKPLKWSNLNKSTSSNCLLNLFLHQS